MRAAMGKLLGIEVLKFVVSIFLGIFLSSGIAFAQGCPQTDGVNRVDGQTEFKLVSSRRICCLSSYKINSKID